MKVERVFGIFVEELVTFERVFPRLKRTVLRIHTFRRYKTRDVAMSFPAEYLVWLHPDVAERLSVPQLRAVFRHELAHVVSPDLSEAEADIMAETVSGERIYYGPDGIQTTGRGVRPRPSYLRR